MNKLRATYVAVAVFAVMAVTAVPAFALPPDVGATVEPLVTSGLTAWTGALTDIWPYLIAVALIAAFIGYFKRKFTKA